MCITVCKIHDQCEFNEWRRMPRASAVGKPRGRRWGGRSVGVQDGGHMCTWGWSLLTYGKKTSQYYTYPPVKINKSVQFSSVAQSCPTHCDPMDRSMPGLPVHHMSLSKPVSIESVMPSSHLILCCPLPPPSIFPSIGVFSNESALRIRWPKY